MTTLRAITQDFLCLLQTKFIQFPIFQQIYQTYMSQRKHIADQTGWEGERSIRFHVLHEINTHRLQIVVHDRGEDTH